MNAGSQDSGENHNLDGDSLDTNENGFLKTGFG